VGFAVFLQELRVLAEMSPATDWLLLAVQSVPFAIALIHDLRRGALSVFLPRWPPVLLSRGVHAIIILLATALIASLLGYAGIAKGIQAVALVAPGFVLMLRWLGRSSALAGLLSTRWREAFAVSANVAMRCCAHCTGS
jgi:hypothetical protein